MSFRTRLLRARRQLRRRFSRRYDVFVSYSHRIDRGLAPGIQAGLERLAKPWYRRHALRVFRDATDLGASPALWPAIGSALFRSISRSIAAEAATGVVAVCIRRDSEPFDGLLACTFRRHASGGA